jgi:hypothetical protein
MAGSVDLQDQLRSIEDDAIPIEHVAPQQDIGLVPVRQGFDRHRLELVNLQLHEEAGHGSNVAAETQDLDLVMLEKLELFEIFQGITAISAAVPI